jgi:hypothetical protein
VVAAYGAYTDQEIGRMILEIEDEGSNSTSIDLF